MKQAFDLQGKVALITGSSRGIGRSIAEIFAQQGARVVISSRKPEACEAVAAAIREQGGEALACPCHIGDKEQLKQLVAFTRDNLGPIDILVCNAATNPVYGSLAELSDAAYDKIMDTNVKSTFWLCNLVLPEMAEQGGGKVILLSSIAAQKGNPVIGCYGMSKAAEAALARNLAVEWGPSNIHVNSIAPGVVVTDFAKALVEDPARKEKVENKTPLRRLGQPEDIAGIALFLASQASSYVTGQVIVADGGETIS
ncbi:SDR family oxidoreductase [Marinospirillum sp.]|uniref:SDR family NAD(P)-dependent oxidoreductase n=1 Tax=Marinospirillum sp. TaxID=2183934 RepID=UPI00287051B2|nr:SDR family oxidoreductase [Marinospirillum sp.]MDR9467888.1 SDR family oxidoreductase [Marinospirillum sp.]